MKKSSDLTTICCCRSVPLLKKIHQYQKACSQLILVCEVEVEPFSGRNITVVPWQHEKGKVSALNKAIQQATKTHILWLEENESLPEIPHLEENTFYPARISNVRAETPAVNWQIRLFPNPYCDEPFFKGFEIPQIYPALNDLNWRQSDLSLAINQRGALFPFKDIRREISQGSDLPMHPFWKGILASGEKQFSAAVSFFKKALKEQYLAPWNRLAAINGFANALMELHEWQEAKKTAEKSLKITAKQQSPYLTLYQYYNIKGESDKAYQQLIQYQKAAKVETEANWDVFMPEAHVAFLIAEISFHQGWHEQAYRYYEQFFVCNNGKVSRPVLERLFLYAVELHQRAKAACYFEALFRNYLTGNLEGEKQSLQIKEALSLFIKNGWYDIASDIYRRLVNRRPDDESLRYGLIRTLVKNGQVEKAQELL
jgi:tetratricopeptide (TPR) repeat protein